MTDNNSNTQKSMSKPSLPFRVEYRFMGGNTPTFKQFAASNSAVKFASQQIQHGSSNVQVHEHDGNNWKLSPELTNKAHQNVQGKGNALAHSELVQLQEYTSVLAKVIDKKQPDTDLVKSWLDQFFTTCKAMGVTPMALDGSKALAYKQLETASKA